MGGSSGANPAALAGVRLSIGAGSLAGILLLGPLGKDPCLSSHKGDFRLYRLLGDPFGAPRQTESVAGLLTSQKIPTPAHPP